MQSVTAGYTALGSSCRNGQLPGGSMDTGRYPAIKSDQ